MPIYVTKDLVVTKVNVLMDYDHMSVFVSLVTMEPIVKNVSGKQRKNNEHHFKFKNYEHLFKD